MDADRNAGRHTRRSPGILLKPRAGLLLLSPRGPFPAVVLSHGAGGSAPSYGRALGAVMRKWGLVCIATNYTHARGVPMGTPGDMLEQGASKANAFRAHAAVTVLARLGYVDVRRVAAHGHSMGAFVTTAFVAAYPSDIRVASHTAGGVLDGIHLNGMPIPSVAEARRIQTPYQWHHGLRDFAVPFLLDDASTPSSPRPTRAISIHVSVTARSPKITRFWNVSTPGTPRTACSSPARPRQPVALHCRMRSGRRERGEGSRGGCRRASLECGSPPKFPPPRRSSPICCDPGPSGGCSTRRPTSWATTRSPSSWSSIAGRPD